MRMHVLLLVNAWEGRGRAWYASRSRQPTAGVPRASMAIAQSAIRDRLVVEGRRIFQEPPRLIPFSKNPDADRLLNDLAGHPHAFLLACIMDRQIKAELAWVIPYRIGQRLTDISFEGVSPVKDVR